MRIQTVKAVILSGGYGTRLRPLSCTRPKLLFPVASRPILDWTIEHLQNSGIKDIVLAVGHMDREIRDHLKSATDVNVTYSKERGPLGTGGAIKNAEEVIGHDEPFLVFNGDVLAFPDLRKLIALHRERGGIATISVYEVDKPERFGVILIDEMGRIKRFVEKPRKRIGNLINAGIYVFEPAIFDFIPKGRISLEREVFPVLCQRGLLYAFRLGGDWVDVGLPEDYLLANKILLKRFGKRVAPSARISPRAIIEGDVAIGDSAEIGDYATIEGSTVIGDNVIIGKGAAIEGSVLFPDVKLGEEASIKEAAIGEGAVIGARAKIMRGCIIGDGVLIRDGLSIHPGVRVCPHKEVKESVLKARSVVI